jgi:hypothetical protein
MKKLMFGTVASTILTGLLASFGAPAHAYVYSTSGQWGSWTDGYYTVYADEWGATSGQSLYVNSASNWVSTSNFTGGGIKAYPSTTFLTSNVALNTLSAVNTSFNFTAPAGAYYDWAYDVWSANNVDEIMVWEQWNGDGPISSAYSSSGAPTPIYSNVSIDGATWNVYQGNPGHNVVSFLRTSQVTSGNQNVLAFMNWCASHNLLVSQTLSSVDFGVEITTTVGTQNFTLNSFSSSVTKAGSYSSGIANGNHILTPQNATGSRLDASCWGTSNGTKVQIWQSTGGTNQNWVFTNQGGGVYTISPSYAPGLFLDVSGAGTANGTIVQLWAGTNASNQKWGAICDGGNVYEFAPQNATGSRLDVSGAGAANGTQVQIWQSTGGSNQKYAVN